MEWIVETLKSKGRYYMINYACQQNWSANKYIHWMSGNGYYRTLNITHKSVKIQ
jgi:hypothetical protein